MEPIPSHSGGILDSFRALGESFIASAEDRVELFGVELQEEKHRVIQGLIWIGAAFCIGMLTLTFASLVLVYLFWDRARLAVLLGLALFYGGVFAAIVVAYRRKVVPQPRPFSTTLTELKEDRACIRPGR